MAVSDPAHEPGHEPAPGGASGQAWAARWSTVVALAVAGAALALLAAGSDPVGAVLAGAAALGALGLAAFDALARPTLAVDRAGLTVHDGWRPRRYAWAEIDRIEVRTTRRLLVLHALEIDAGDDLVLLTRRRLGTDLAEVSARLAEHRAAATR
ncbi:MAG: PH domain-containing protein [Frankiaceae bacterium]